MQIQDIVDLISVIKTMRWTSVRVEKLKQLWKKGHTASQIASQLGDTTRNAVIGVLWPFSLRGATRLLLEKHID